MIYAYLTNENKELFICEEKFLKIEVNFLTLQEKNFSAQLSFKMQHVFVSIVNYYIQKKKSK